MVYCVFSILHFSPLFLWIPINTCQLSIMFEWPNSSLTIYINVYKTNIVVFMAIKKAINTTMQQNCLSFRHSEFIYSFSYLHSLFKIIKHVILNGVNFVFKNPMQFNYINYFNVPAIILKKRLQLTTISLRLIYLNFHILV